MKISRLEAVILIKVLSQVCLLISSLFPIPVEVANCNEKLQRDFLWSGIGEDPKLHLVNFSNL